MAIRQMRLQDHIPIRTDIVAGMAIDANFARRNAAQRHFAVRITEQDDRVDEVCGGLVGGQECDTVVDDLAALAVAADAELGVWAFREGLFDELDESLAICLPACWSMQVDVHTEARFSLPLKLPPRQ